MKFFCWIGWHQLNRNGAFQRKCSRCGAEFRADYFDWRADGYPTWRRIQHTKDEK